MLSASNQKTVLLLSALLATAYALPVVDEDPSVVHLDKGPIRGTVTDTYREFKGIPYAAPPVNDLRWADPKQPSSWDAVLSTTEYSAGCPQDCNEPPGTCPEKVDEDCLYLNVWTPANVKAGDTDGVPVMVWFPGGNYKQEAASVDFYYGQFISNFTNTILVTVNYRLGILGFLTTDNGLNGNYGFKDQIASLKWVQTNIAQFGGDPSRVTIIGQSAGAASTSLHMISEKSKGLFHRVISMSDTLGINFQDRSGAEKQGKKVAKQMGCAHWYSSSIDVSCMRKKRWQDVLDTQLNFKGGIPLPHLIDHGYTWEPWVGQGKDAYFPDNALKAIENGDFHSDIPMMIGTMKQEGVQFVNEIFKGDKGYFAYFGILALVFGPVNAYKINSVYGAPPYSSEDTRPYLADVATDYVFACPTRAAARRVSKGSTPVYVYFYDHAFTFPGWVGTNYSYCQGKVCHGSELPILFHSAGTKGFKYSAGEEVLSRQMAHFYGKFAYGETTDQGDLPGYDQGVSWPAFTEENDDALVFDVPELKIVSRRRGDECDLWDELGYGTF